MYRWVVSAVCACALIFFRAPAACADDSSSGSPVDPARASLVPSPDLPTVLGEARTLLDAGKPREAYALLTEHEVAFAGTPEYDYLFGLAALDSKRPKEAAFALERVVAEQPDFLGAR